MDSESLNHDLFNFYSGISSQLSNILKVYKNSALPQFINVPEGYVLTAKKLMIVGQQTNGWDDGKTRVSFIDPTALMKLYATFNLGKKYSATPFWQAAHRLEGAINPAGPPRSFLWSNLVKTDQNGKRPIPELEEAINTYQILQTELSITKPDIVLFFTGPDYDERLIATFPSVQIKPNSHLLSRLIHPQLPVASFRTYHPNYLRRSRKWHVLDKIVSEVQNLWA